jgi:ABC-type sugar transport system permease subunit
MKKSLIPYVFLLPALVLFSLFTLYPLIFNVVYSVYQIGANLQDWKFVGFTNYRIIFDDFVFWKSLKNNFLFWAGTVFLETTIGLGIALLLDRSFRGRTLFRTVFFFPYVISWVVIALIFVRIYDPYIGFINLFLKVVGLKNLTRYWLANPQTALVSLVGVFVWKMGGFAILLFLAGLQGIPVALREAAEIDGASRTTVFLHITLPLLRPIVAVVVTLLTIYSFRIFPLVYSTTHGGPHYATEVPVTYLYRFAFQFYRFGQACSVAVVVMCILIGLATLRGRIAGKVEFE